MPKVALGVVSLGLIATGVTFFVFAPSEEPDVEDDAPRPAHGTPADRVLGPSLGCGPYAQGGVSCVGTF